MSRPLPEGESRYTPIAQKINCCVPTCIQMILQKHNLPIRTQDELGYHLGMVVLPKDAAQFDPVRIGVGKEADIGTRMLKPEYDFNAVSKRLGLGLKMECIPPASLGTPSELIKRLEQVEEADGDAVICYDFPTLYDNGNNGHANVFDKILPGSKIQHIDPISVPANPNHLYSSDASQLLLAMAVHAEFMGGLWNITTDL